MKYSVESMVAEIDKRINLLESNLPHAVDPLISRKSKLPYKAMFYREAAIWRVAELSRGAFENFEKDRLALAILATRAALETSAGLCYLRVKLDNTVKSRVLADVDDCLMRLAMGIRAEPDDSLQAISVLTFVQCADKQFRGLLRQYEILSEYAHPNWAGSGLLYSNTDKAKVWTVFGTNVRDLLATKMIGVRALGMTLELLERSYNGVADLMPAFIELCETPVYAEPFAS